MAEQHGLDIKKFSSTKSSAKKKKKKKMEKKGVAECP
jgi:hypothetical protein